MDHWSDLVLKLLYFFHHFLLGILPIKVCNVIWVNSLIFIGFFPVLSWVHWQINYDLFPRLNLLLALGRFLSLIHLQPELWAEQPNLSMWDPLCAGGCSSWTPFPTWFCLVLIRFYFCLFLLYPTKDLASPLLFTLNKVNRRVYTIFFILLPPLLHFFLLISPVLWNSFFYGPFLTDHRVKITTFCPGKPICLQ